MTHFTMNLGFIILNTDGSSLGNLAGLEMGRLSVPILANGLKVSL